jgi:hypothetical protein
MIVENFGLAGNRITLDPDDPGRIRIDDTVDGDLAQRARRARKLLERRFRGLKTLSLQNSVSLNLGQRPGLVASARTLRPACSTPTASRTVSTTSMWSMNRSCPAVAEPTPHCTYQVCPQRLKCSESRQFRHFRRTW